MIENGAKRDILWLLPSDKVGFPLATFCHESARDNYTDTRLGQASAFGYYLLPGFKLATKVAEEVSISVVVACIFAAKHRKCKFNFI